jgi:hypothetical protein
MGEPDAQRGGAHDLGVVRDHGRFDQLHLLAGPQRARPQLDRLHRHRPQQLHRHAGHLRGRPGVVLFEQARQERAGRAAVLCVRVPGAASQLGGDEARAVTVEDGVGKIGGHP